MLNDDKLTSIESAVLLLLMVEAREIPNAEITKRGSVLTQESRKKLNDLGYLESRTDEKNRIFHSLGDKGWRLLQEGDLTFSAVAPRIMGNTLVSLIAALRGRVLPRTNVETFGELFSLTTVVPSQRAEPQKEIEPSGQGDDLEARIRDAYKGLTTEPGAWVSLARLRGQLTDVPRDELDDAIERLSLERGVHLIPESNQKALTQAEIDAALRSGGQDNHLLAIGV